MPESTLNLLLSGLMGLVGGMLTIPVNALVSWWLKRNEQRFGHELDWINKQREILLQHQLEMERKGRSDEIAELKAAIERLERRIGDG